MWMNSNKRSVSDIRQIPYSGNAPFKDRAVTIPAKKSSAACGLNIPSDCSVYLTLNGDMQNKMDGEFFTGTPPDFYGGENGWGPTFVAQGNRLVGAFSGNNSQNICFAPTYAHYLKYVLSPRNFYWKDEETYVEVYPNDHNIGYWWSKVNYDSTVDLPQYGTGQMARLNEKSFTHYGIRTKMYEDQYPWAPGVSTDFTICMWLRYTPGNANICRCPMSWQTSGQDGWDVSGGWFAGCKYDSRIGVGITGGGTDQISDSNQNGDYGVMSTKYLDDSQWHFVVARYKIVSVVTPSPFWVDTKPLEHAVSYRVATRKLELWIDNEFQGESTVWKNSFSCMGRTSGVTGHYPAYGMPFRIGGYMSTWVASRDAGFEGKIAEFMWFNRYLNDDELTRLYYRGIRVLNIALPGYVYAYKVHASDETPLYTNIDMGPAMIIDQVVYYQLPDLVAHAAVTDPTPSSSAIVSYTFDRDADNVVGGSNHRTWTPHEVAISMLSVNCVRSQGSGHDGPPVTWTAPSAGTAHFWLDGGYSGFSYVYVNSVQIFPERGIPSSYASAYVHHLSAGDVVVINTDYGYAQHGGNIDFLPDSY